ncbi:MAG: hypothetical protein RIT27_2241 [Pseudomonadota bacterium]
MAVYFQWVIVSATVGGGACFVAGGGIPVPLVGFKARVRIYARRHAQLHVDFVFVAAMVGKTIQIFGGDAKLFFGDFYHDVLQPNRVGMGGRSRERNPVATST